MAVDSTMPVLATVVVVSLGIGIGVNTAVFSWVQAVVLRPLPGVRMRRAFTSSSRAPTPGRIRASSWQEYRDLRERLRSFPELLAVPHGAVHARRRRPLGAHLRPARVRQLLFRARHAAGARPLLPRPTKRTRPGSEPVAVVSHDFWQTRLGGAADVVGQTLRVNDQQLTVIGVAPERFQGTILGLNFDIWMPATMAPLAPGRIARARRSDDARLQHDGEAAGRDLARAGAGASSIR